jgi:uncharacterized protein (DUF488 family)
VRHFPRSRRNPQVNKEVLERELPLRGIAYFWVGETLGGFRPGGYQAYMGTLSFAKGIARLEEITAGGITAIMCAEIVWFRCHRRFIARQMAARGYRVTHIVGPGKPGYEQPLPPDTQQLRIPSMERDGRA